MLLWCVRQLAGTSPADPAPPLAPSLSVEMDSATISLDPNARAPGLSCVATLRSWLGGMRGRVLDCEVEDFGFDTAAEMTPSTIKVYKRLGLRPVVDHAMCTAFNRQHE